ncbi:Cytochrome P450 3A12 [Coccomyxa sp. Obi]|nr:Cytochrome P450 3A12 [Coccomyxa sp. Obi]
MKLGGIFKAHQKYAQKYGPIFVARNVHTPIVMVESPELARKVLLQNNYRCVFPNLLHGEDAKFEESTYLDTRGDKLKTVRGAWQPFFFSGSLEGFMTLMKDSADLLVDSVEMYAKNGAAMDIHAMIGAMTVQVVGTTAFGVNFHTQAADKAGEKNSDYVKRLLKAVYDIMAPKAFSFSMYTPPLILFPFAGPLIKLLAHYFPDEGLSRVKAGRQVIIDIVKELLAQRREELAVEQNRTAKGLSKLRASFAEATGERRGVAPGSFVDLLVNATDKATGTSLTDLERTNQAWPQPPMIQLAFVMVLSAYETTANALAFTMYLLSKPENAEKLAKLTAEIDAFGRERVPTFEELDQFPWLEACLREGMRIFPPVPTLTREAERDMDLAGYKVPKGTMLGVAVYSMHNNPAYWQEPERYLPERFIEGTPEYAAKPAHGYLPFGDGLRQCIGLRFAIMEAKITLIRLYQRFTFELQAEKDSLELRETITISAANGVLVKAIPRPPPNNLF